MDYEVIGIDHGYKNIKTSHSLFRTALVKLDSEPDDKKGVIGYKDEFYSIYGNNIISVNEHNKAKSGAFYMLTLAALAKELDFRKKKKANVYIAAGLPVKWYDAQKEDFRKMLMQNKNLHFSFEGRIYDVALSDVRVYKQGVAACLFLGKDDIQDNPVLVDIGGETVDIIPLIDGVIAQKDSKISTDATIWLIKNIQEHIESVFYERIDEKEIIKAMIEGPTDTKDEFLQLVYGDIVLYTEKIFNLLKEYKYNLLRNKVIFMGGGASAIKNFGEYSKYKMDFLTDISANAKGFELLLQHRLRR